MDIKAVEHKWQSIWEKTKFNHFDAKSDKPKQIGRASCRERV